jgi:hypothetical protein
MNLAALLRNFFAATSNPHPIPGAQAPTAPFRFEPQRNQKPAKVKGYHFAKRNETFLRANRKSLESLLALNQSFRGIVCFQ